MIDKPDCRVAKNIVKEAQKRSELFGILSFLDKRLPAYAEVSYHGIQWSKINLKNTNYRYIQWPLQSCVRIIRHTVFSSLANQTATVII